MRNSGQLERADDQGMAHAGRTLEEPAWLVSALARRFHPRPMWQNGRLLATCKDGKAHLNISGWCVPARRCWVLQAEFANRQSLPALADVLLEHSRTRRRRIFATSHDHEKQSTADPADSATPSATASRPCLATSRHCWKALPQAADVR
jgi:hypothetical protein